MAMSVRASVRAPLLAALPAGPSRRAPRGQIIVAMLSREAAQAQGLVECLRCDAWHTPGDAAECDRRGFIRWADRRAEAHAVDPTW